MEGVGSIYKLVAGIFVLIFALAVGGCYRTGVEYRSGRDIGRLPAASVVMSSDASYRLLISPSRQDAPSRLWAVHARIATFDDTPLQISSDGAQLVLADGTRARTLDQARVVALLKRTEIGTGDPAYPLGVSRHATGGLSEREKTAARSEILAFPFVAGELTRSHPIEGYLVVDAKHELASLDGALLEVAATRISDGAFVRHTYRFTTPTEGARADATVTGQ
jgi:hypothetical protein